MALEIAAYLLIYTLLGSAAMSYMDRGLEETKRIIREDQKFGPALGAFAITLFLIVYIVIWPFFLIEYIVTMQKGKK